MFNDTRKIEKKRIFLLLTAILIISLFATPLFIMLGMHSSIAKDEVRNIKLGTLLAASDPYRLSPFAVDLILDGKSNSTSVLYKKPADTLKSNVTNTSEFTRIYLQNSGKLILSYFLNFPKNEKRTPRVFIYNDLFQLSHASKNSNSKLIKNVFQVEFDLQPGLYKIKHLFDSSSLQQVTINFEINKQSNLSFKEYVQKNIKSIHIDILPGQLTKLNELRMARKLNWASLPKGDWSKRYLPSLKESLQARVRTPNGDWSVVELRLSGRNQAHFSNNVLPSLDVKVVAGELPYGLRRFKLYTLASKTDGLDMFLEQLIGDILPPMYRQDIVRILLNGKFVGYSQLWENVDTHFFEYAQRIQGPILGFDMNSLIANRGHSWFISKSSYKKTSYPININQIPGTLSFSKQICPGEMEKLLSFGMYYVGLHGFGADTRFHVNNRQNCITPLFKDINSGFMAMSNASPNLFVNHPFFSGLISLSVLTPSWRPYVPTYASYFVFRESEEKDKQQGFFWWTFTPPILNTSLLESSDANLLNGLNHWYGKTHQERAKKRKSNFLLAVTTLQGEIKKKISKAISSIVTVENAIIKEEWKGMFLHNEKCLNTASYLQNAIQKSSKGVTFPTCKELSKLHWRNKRLMKWADDVSLLKQLPKDNSKIFTKNYDAQSLTFLYQRFTKKYGHLFFVQRNCKATCKGKLLLKDDQNNIFHEASNIYETGFFSPSLKLTNIFINDIKSNERIRIHYFKIPRKNTYTHLIPQYKGIGHYIGSHGLALPPIEPPAKSINIAAPLEKYFLIKDNILIWKLSPPEITINDTIIIPKGYTWKIADRLEIAFSKKGCLEVRGQLAIHSKAKLILGDTGKGWSGIHFQNSPDQNISGLIIENVGYQEETVVCNHRNYTGGVSIFESKIQFDKLHISNNQTEDALHLLNSQITLKNSTIKNSKSDAIDVDFSAIIINGSLIDNAGTDTNIGGDGLDLSGSLGLLNSITIINSTDKNISVGENSIVNLTNSLLSHGEFGVALKDSSIINIQKTKIEASNIGIAVYSKKPYYRKPTFNLSDNNVLFINVNIPIKNSPVKKLSSVEQYLNY